MNLNKSDQFLVSNCYRGDAGQEEAGRGMWYLTRVVVTPSPGSTIPPGKLQTPLSRRWWKDENHIMIIGYVVIKPECKQTRALSDLRQVTPPALRAPGQDPLKQHFHFHQFHHFHFYHFHHFHFHWARSTQATPTATPTPGRDPLKQHFLWTKHQQRKKKLVTGSRFQRVTTGSAAWFGPHLCQEKVQECFFLWGILVPAKHSSSSQSSPAPRVQWSVGVVHLIFTLVAPPVHLLHHLPAPESNPDHLVLPDKGHRNQGIEGRLPKTLVAKVGEVRLTNLERFYLKAAESSSGKPSRQSGSI